MDRAVLLVDDEKAVRDVARHMLEDRGVTVLVAENGDEALDVFRREKDRIGCVLLDLTMPRMSGDETFEELRRIDPGLPVVLMSGYEEEDVASRMPAENPPGFIQKPYTGSQLFDMLKKTTQHEAG